MKANGMSTCIRHNTPGCKICDALTGNVAEHGPIWQQDRNIENTSYEEWQEREYDKIAERQHRHVSKEQEIPPRELQAKRLAECALERIGGDGVFESAMANILRARLGRNPHYGEDDDVEWIDAYNELLLEMSQAMVKYLRGDYLE